MHAFAPIAALLIFLRWLGQVALERLNRGNVLANADTIPEAFRDTIDSSTYRKAVEYTLAKNRFAVRELTASTVVLMIVLFSGVLPRAWQTWSEIAGTGAWAAATGLFLGAVVLALPGLPFEWWSQFRLEDRFGFNTTTQATWWLDRLKTGVLAAALGIPLLALLLHWVNAVGALWWLWSAATLILFQWIMLFLAPALILPLFNKFQPLADGSLRSRLLDLAARTGFHARAIEVMDGSRRSRHANAFFTGLGRLRKIVLFDTLLGQLGETEIEAVLAHEIGHFRRGHLPKLLAWSAVMTGCGFAVLAWLAGQRWFFEAFGFAAPSIPVAFLLFALLSDTATFWISPLSHALSRRFEYEADSYAAEALGTGQPLIAALRKLHTKNLANLTPHPLYSRFYYSHPTLLEREQALRPASACADS